MIEIRRTSPDIGAPIGGAFRDTWPAMQTWMPWLIGSIVVICLGALGVFESGFFQAVMTKPPGEIAHPEYYGLGIGVADIAFVVGATFALASSVRTVRPDFRMSVGKFFGFLGYAILSGLIIVLGFFCLVIPGFYLAIKLGPAPYMYLLGESDPLKRSWEITKDRFWWTVLLMLLVGVCAQVGLYAIVIVGAIFYFIPFAIFAFVPIAVAALFAVYQFQYNAYMRWYDTLIKTA